MFKIVKYFIFCLIIQGCTAEGCAPTAEPMPPAGEYNASVFFTGGGFCINEFSDFDLDLKVFAPGTDGKTTLAWTNIEPNSNDPKTVSSDPSNSLQPFKINGSNTSNTNPMQIRVPEAGSFTIQVTMTAKKCIKCCTCFGKGGKAILTGKSTQTKNLGIPIEIIMQHQNTSEGCPLNGCCL